LAANIFLMFFKLWAGLATKSQALVADALHTLSDLFTDAVALVGLKLGRREEDLLHPYGHGRIETMASMLVGVLLIASGVYISVEGVINIVRGHISHPSAWALGAAFVSIVVKEVLYRFTIKVGKGIRSQVVIGNAWHHRSDAFSSIAVVLGVGAGLISPKLASFDIYAAILVALFILKVGASITFEAVKEVIDTSPDQLIIERIQHCATQVEGVLETHDLKARTSGGSVIMDLHISVDPGLTVEKSHTLAKEVESCIKKGVDVVSSVTIHVDPYRGEAQNPPERSSDGKKANLKLI